MSSVFLQGILKNKVALVTGGGTGINFGIVQALGAHGCKVVITGRRKEALEKAIAQLAKDGIEALAVPGDVRKYDDCKAAVDATIAKFGKLDILVNGAAGNFLCLAEDLTPNGFKTVLEIDTLGTFHMSRAALEALKKSGKSVIINISTTHNTNPTLYQIHASTAKAGVDAMTKALALEWGKYGIRVVAIAPGGIEGTEGVTRLSGGEGLKHDLVPVGRSGTLNDIAQVAVFLASPAASFISGQIISVDGAASLYRVPFVTEEKYKQIAAARSKL